MVQSGVQSPKPTPVSSSTSQSKVGSDIVQNITSTFPILNKGRKRERGDRVSEFVRQDPVVKMDDQNSANNRSESSIKSEIFKIAEKGGLADAEGVARMIQLMLPDGSGKKIDLAARSKLAGVIAATEKLECLSLFVQHRGLSVLDEWLQEVHKGKIGDSSPKDTGRAVEEFLLIVLRALEKLPVNLPALQMCNIGKSVNHLRTHRNSEIQKKARSLVDTWKKRVAAEMSINDVSSTLNQVDSWSAQSLVVSHGRNRHLGAISDAAVKSLGTQQTTKIASVKLVHGEGTTRAACTSPHLKKVASLPSPTTQLKDGQPILPADGDASELSRTMARDEKSSTSSQSHNTGQFYSSEHGKFIGLVKENMRSSTVGSLSLNKISSGSSRPWKSFNGCLNTVPHGVQKEFGRGRRSSLQQNTGAERLFQSGLTSEKAPDLTVSENIQNSTVKIPNQGRSPSQSTSEGSFEDDSVMTSEASSPMLLENHHHLDDHSKEKIDSEKVNATLNINAESWQSNDFKGVATASDVGDGSPVVHDGEHCRTSNHNKVVELYSSSGENKIGSLTEASYDTINALIETCIKQSEAEKTILVADDVGMKLLASVATGEMSKLDVVLTTDSPQRNATVEYDYSRLVADLKEESSSHGELSRDHVQSNNCVDDRHNTDSGADSGESKPSQSENSPSVEHLNSSHEMLEVKAAPPPESTIKMSEVVIAVSPMFMSGSSTDAVVTNTNDIKKNDASVKDSIYASEMIQNDDQMSTKTLLQPERTIDDEKITASEHSMSSGVGIDFTDQKNDYVGENLGNVDISGRNNEQVYHEKHPDCRVGEKEKFVAPEESKLPGTEAEKTPSSTIDAASLSATSVADMHANVEFDLNECFDVDDGECGESNILVVPESCTGVKLISPLLGPVSSITDSVLTSITVTAAAKAPFFPLDDLVRNKGEIGWKGSAATSAFRPAEPRKVVETTLCNDTSISLADTTAIINHRPCLDIDLNVPVEGILEDISHQNFVQDSGFVCPPTSNHDLNHNLGSSYFGSFGGLDLDLNQADEAIDVSNYSTRNVSGKEAPLPASKPYSLPFNGGASVQRNFDLNGPIVEEVSVEPSLFNEQSRSNIPIQSFPSGSWMKNPETVNSSRWFPPGNTNSTATMSSVMSRRLEQPVSVTSGGPQRILSPTFGNNSFGPDVYGGAPLSSSVVPFPPAPFQYHFFPFGTSFPLTSGSFSSDSTPYVDSSSGGRFCFHAVPPQLFGPAGTVSTHYPRPYVVSIPDGSNGSDERNKKWGKQGLDLNVGPGGLDTQRKNESLFFSQKQLSAATSQVQAEDHIRAYQPARGTLKRKDPEGGWDGYQQPSR